MSVYLVSKNVQEVICEAKTHGHTNLYLNYQQLKELPEELFELDKVKNIFLKYNILQQLPSHIWKLQSLVELYLHSNNLETLPEEIGQVESLKSLNIGNNYLKSLPSTVGDLTRLKDLHLANNQLNFLPDSLGNLNSLKVLDVMNNNLSKLPWQLCNCCKLETLLLDGNKIQWIPRQLTKLSQLKELSASRNQLTCIPQDINGMVLLENLLLDSNACLCALPATVLHLKNLLMVGLNQCRHLKKPVETSMIDLSRCFQDIMFIGSSLEKVCPLLELSLRTVYKLCNYSFPSREGFLPKNLLTLLRSPTGHCYSCRQPFFVGVFAITTDVKKACKISRNSMEIDMNSELPILYEVCSYNCMQVVEGILRDVT